MGLVPQFNMGDIDAFLRNAEEQHQRQIIRVLRFVGEKAVNEARANGTYKDQTANLRNSIGYVIVVNGKIVDQDFSSTATGAKPSADNPVKYGRDLAYEIALGQPDIALIVVAGMKYGLYVEAIGLNVLTSAEQLANIQVPMLLKQIK